MTLEMPKIDNSESEISQEEWLKKYPQIAHIKKSLDDLKKQFDSMQDDIDYIRRQNLIASLEAMKARMEEELNVDFDNIKSVEEEKAA